MKNTEQKIPALRFPEFTGEWEEKRLGEITKINQGLQIAIVDRLTEKVPDSHFYITNEFLKKGSDKKYYIINPPKSVLCNEDDILMTRTGNTGIVVTGIEGAFHNNFFKIQFDRSKYNGTFFISYLRLEKTQKQIIRYAGASTIPDLNHSDFYRLNFTFPSFPEQQKIANFLSAVDKRLQLLKDKKTKLEEYKRGVMQRIFSQELRFTRPDGSAYPDWEEKRLGEITEIIMGQSPDSAYYNEKGIGEVLIQGNADIKNRETTKRLWTTQITKKCLFNDLILTVRAPVGSIAKATFTACIGRGVCAIRPKSTATVNFLFQTLIVLEPSWRRLEQGSTFTSVNSTDINNFKIKLPHIDEQRQIADFLSAIDDKISLLSKQIQSTEQYKKGLLQQMFV